VKIITQADQPPCLTNVCGECGLVQEKLIQIGEPPDYESATARVCAHCLRAALALHDEGTIRARWQNRELIFCAYALAIALIILIGKSCS
jgi:hypothetical protein